MKSKLGRLIAGATLLLTSSTFYSLPASAQRATGNVDVGLNIDVNGLVNEVSSAIRGQNNRSACVKAASEAAYSRVGQRANVMVFNLNQNYAKKFTGRPLFRRISCAGVTYGLWVFKSGTFQNRGDGGFINWTFQGNWKRTGRENKTVIFSRIR
ncbi:MAG: hypothetical protein ACFCUV_27480 [Rivularia sp. (in: cyanobacteria)]